MRNNERRPVGRLRASPVGVRLPTTAASFHSWRQNQQSVIVHRGAPVSSPFLSAGAVATTLLMPFPFLPLLHFR